MGSKEEPRVLRLANEDLAWFRRWEGRLRRRPRTWDQIEGTASSILANPGDALDPETLPERWKYFGYAKASAGEGIKLVEGTTRNGMLRHIRLGVVRLIRWTRH